MKYKFKQGAQVDLTKLIIHGKRVLLCALEERFIDDIYREFNLHITRYMMPKPADDVSEIRAFVLNAQQGMRDSSDLVLAIVSQDDNAFLGCCGFHLRAGPNMPELGIWLKQSAHRKGLGLEAIQTLCYWVLQFVEFDYLLYPVDKANIASRRIPEALGGEIYQTKKVQSMSGNILNEVVYKITADQLSLSLNGM